MFISKWHFSVTLARIVWALHHISTNCYDNWQATHLLLTKAFKLPNTFHVGVTWIKRHNNRHQLWVCNDKITAAVTDRQAGVDWQLIQSWWGWRQYAETLRSPVSHPQVNTHTRVQLAALVIQCLIHFWRGIQGPWTCQLLSPRVQTSLQSTV